MKPEIFSKAQALYRLISKLEGEILSFSNYGETYVQDGLVSKAMNDRHIEEIKVDRVKQLAILKVEFDAL